MREKKVRQETIDKYLDYLRSVQDNQLPYNCQKTLETIATNYAINKTVTKAIVNLGFVERQLSNKTAWYWLKGKPDKQMVLEILDYLLHLKKKTVHVPLMPDYATIISHLKEISDKLSVSITQQERLLKTDKKPIQSNEVDLFLIDNQRLQVACAIATGIYSSESAPGVKFDCLNQTIISATDDLMKKLLNKE